MLHQLGQLADMKGSFVKWHGETAPIVDRDGLGVGRPRSEAEVPPAFDV